MKTQQLLKASAIGIGIMVAFYLIILSFSYGLIQEMITLFSDPAFFESTATAPVMPPEFERFVTLGPLLGLIGCFAWLIPGLVSGLLYARWHNQTLPIESGAVKGGAAAGAITNALGYFIVGLISTAVILPLQMQMMETVMNNAGAGVPPFPFGGFMAVMTVISLFCSLLFNGVLGAGIGALGGLIGDSTSKGKSVDYAGGDVIG